LKYLCNAENFSLREFMSYSFLKSPNCKPKMKYDLPVTFILGDTSDLFCFLPLRAFICTELKYICCESRNNTILTGMKRSIVDSSYRCQGTVTRQSKGLCTSSLYYWLICRRVWIITTTCSKRE
jgi:hypothetical protein